MKNESALKMMIDGLGLGDIDTVAGVGFREGVLARDAPCGWTLGVVRRPDGDLLVADYKGHRIWRIDSDGILHTFAGDGIPGNSGDGGPAAAARCQQPVHVVVQRHVANHQHHTGFRLSRSVTQRRGDDPVDTVHAPICRAEQGLVCSRQEGVHVPDRHAITGEQSRAVGQQLRQLREHLPLEELLHLL